MFIINFPGKIFRNEFQSAYLERCKASKLDYGAKSACMLQVAFILKMGTAAASIHQSINHASRANYRNQNTKC